MEFSLVLVAATSSWPRRQSFSLPREQRLEATRWEIYGQRPRKYRRTRDIYGIEECAAAYVADVDCARTMAKFLDMRTLDEWNGSSRPHYPCSGRCTPRYVVSDNCPLDFLVPFPDTIHPPLRTIVNRRNNTEYRISWLLRHFTSRRDWNRHIRFKHRYSEGGEPYRWNIVGNLNWCARKDRVTIHLALFWHEKLLLRQSQSRFSLFFFFSLLSSPKIVKVQTCVKKNSFRK